MKTSASSSSSSASCTVDINKPSQGRSPAFLMACCIGSMSVAYGSLFDIGSISEKVSAERGLFLVLMGFVYFVSLTEFCNKCMMDTVPGEKFRLKYRLLKSDVMDITNKIVSAVQATLSCIAGYMVCTSSCKRSFLTASHYMSDVYAWFGCAYFIYDMWSMYEVHVQKIADKLKMIKDDVINENVPILMKSDGLYDKLRIDDGYHSNGGGGGGGGGADHLTTSVSSISSDKQRDEEERLFLVKRLQKVPIETPGFIYYCLSNPVMTIHHVFIGSFGLFVIVYLRGTFGDCVYGFIYLMEFSTPFVCIRGILSIMRMKDTTLYVINGIAMLISFFICRIVMWPYLYYWYSGVVNMSVFQAIMSLPRTCKIGTLILFLPQLYWFYLMLRGAVQVFFPSKQKGSKKPHSNIRLTASTNDRTPNDGAVTTQNLNETQVN